MPKVLLEGAAEYEEVVNVPGQKRLHSAEHGVDHLLKIPRDGCHAHRGYCEEEVTEGRRDGGQRLRFGVEPHLVET